MAKNINVILNLQDRFSRKLNKASLETLQFKRNLAVMQYGSEKAAGVMKAMERAAIGTATALGAAGVAFAKTSLDTYKQVNNVFNDVAGIKGLKATDEEMQKLIEHTKEYAKEVKGITYEQAGEALKYMTLAGWSTEQSEQAMPAVLKAMRISGDEDTRTVADALTDSMTALGLKSYQADEYVDLSAAVQGASNTNMLQLQEALIKSGAGMSTLYGRYKDIYGEDKGRIEATKETMALVGALSSAGIKAEQSGTVINSLFTRFVKDSAEAQKGLDAIGMSMYDNDGKLKTTLKIFTELAQKAEGMNEQERNSAFSKIGGRFRSQLEVLISSFNELGEDGQTAIEKINKAMDESEGYAQRYVDTLNSGYSGKVAEMSASWFNFKADVGEIIAPYAIEAMDYVLGKMPEMQQWLENKLPGYMEKAKEILLEIKDILAWVWEHKEGIAIGAGAAYAGMGALRVGTFGLVGYDTLQRVIKGRTAEKAAEAALTAGSAKNVVGGLGSYINFGAAPMSYTMPTEIGTSLAPLGTVGAGTATGAVGGAGVAGTAAEAVGGAGAAGAAATVGTILAVVVALEEAFRNSEDLQNSIGRIWDTIKKGGGKAFELIKGVAEDLAPVFEALGPLWTSTFGLLGDLLSAAIDGLYWFLEPVGKLLKFFAEPYWEVFKMFIKGYADIFEKLAGFATTVVEKLRNFIDLWREVAGERKEKKKNPMTTEEKRDFIGSYLDEAMANLFTTNALGTNYWKGGITSVNERGGEIMDLPEGTRIYPADKSEKMMKKMTQGNGMTVIVNVENFYGDDERYIDRIGRRIGGKLAAMM